jgi:signal transduction histidine kinase
MSFEKIRPYARLITMLGDQLIKNEQFALSEIVKNSYDADADWVKVTFEGFDSNFNYTVESQIVITDNGIGMDVNTILENWMNPATHNKKSGENGLPKVTDKGRVIQGEKGIGRFSLFKLGKHIEVITRTKNSEQEHTITYDFTNYDEDFTKVYNKEEKKWIENNIYLDQLSVNLDSDISSVIVHREVRVNHKLFKKDNAHGTKIIIKSLKGNWSKIKIYKAHKELYQIQSGLEALTNKKPKHNIEIGFAINDEELSLDKEKEEWLRELIENKKVLEISNGTYNDNTKTFSFDLNGKPNELYMGDHEIQGLTSCKNSYWNQVGTLFENMPQIGNFKFHYYIFDFNAKEPSKFYLTRKDKELLREHRVYLFRDNIRVYPYGSPNDDWLQVDIHRGLIRASDFASNDQTLGWIEISKEDNPRLKDKTNREGLLEADNTTQAFKELNKIFLNWVRFKPYSQYQIREKRAAETKKDIKKDINQDFKTLFDALDSTSDQPKAEMLKSIELKVENERKYLERRVELTEELAGVGLSVETASHDLMLMLTKGLGGIHDLTKEVMNKSRDFNEIEEELNKLGGMFSFVKNQMQDIQLLYTSSKRRRKQLRVKDLLEKVAHFYTRVLKKAGIEYEIELINSPLVVKCTDAVLMQTFINLFDNSFYWLKISNQKDKRILIQLDGMRNRMIFSDNGPGLHTDDIPYLFEPFYSGKGDEGRGLGLYISRKLLNKNDYEIEVADLKSEKLLSGANFVIDFNEEPD